MVGLKVLKTAAQGLSILYAEDNEALRVKAEILLKKFFDKVDVAADGQIALDLYKKHHYPIVITDIKMPNMDGMTLIKHLKKINPEVKTIIMSAFDKSDLLIKGIELGVFRFLKKPVDVRELSTVLYQAIIEINHTNNTKIFYMNLENIFDYQSSMVVMLDGKKTVLANDVFLDFFDFEGLEESKVTLFDISQRFLVHDGFLYPDETNDVSEILLQNKQKLFHIKMKDREDNIHHFIVKYQEIPKKEGFGILSFDDITELNLLTFFDAKASNHDEYLHNQKAMLDLLGVISRNSAKVKIHNYYKGLSITNSAVIVDIKDDNIVIKTSYIQQKAIQIEHKLLLVSSALPFVIEATKIEKINFEKQTVSFSVMKFIKTSPITRETVRVVPSQKQTASLFIGTSRFHAEIEIMDISVNAVKLKLNALPPGLDKESEVVLDLVLELDKKPLIINTKASMYRKSESTNSFYVVFLFKDLKKSALVKYVTKRQMALIREIKGMQNG